MNSIAGVYANRKMLVILCLAFSSGIPLALVGGTLQAWMASENVDLAVIGVFSLVGLPYALKFLWAPLMDRFIPPFLGRRRGWMILCQIALILSLSIMAFSDPTRSPAFLAFIAVFVAWFSASQDIVIDAYRTETLQPEEFGAGAGIHILGYRIAMLFSGALALILADHLPWKTVYLIMASSIGVGLVANLFAPEPVLQNQAPKSLKSAVVEPFLDFFKRRRAFELLVFIIIYKLDVVVATALMTPFILGLGFTKSEIGAVTKGFGLVATIIGSLAGGAWMTQLGIHRSLWLFGILQGISGFCFYLLAHLGHHYPMMVTTIAAENFFSGMGNAVYFAFLMSLCNPKFTATQYALLSSMMAVTRVIAGAPTGWLAKHVGWEAYFLISIAIAIPGLLLLLRYDAWTQKR